MRLRLWDLLVVFLALRGALGMDAHGATIRVATFNVENYLDEPVYRRSAKSVESKAAVCRSILAMSPDVLGLQEMGSTNALLELQAALRRNGLDLPFWEHVSAYDTNVHLSVLSRFQLSDRRLHTNETFLLSGRRLPVSRGFAELDVNVSSNFVFTLVCAHLKSRRPSVLADESEWREEEAAILRSIVDHRLSGDPKRNLIVLGDFNDVKNSRVLKTVVGNGENGLFDTCPAERTNTDASSSLLSAGGKGRKPARKVVWTQYYSEQDVYSRFDYILISKGMKRYWIPEKSWVLSMPDWGVASDHRPVVVSFSVPKRK